jgi:hypothetical protein
MFAATGKNKGSPLFSDGEGIGVFNQESSVAQ